ncbi:DUF1302 domain-containing protein [Desulfopila sp. IMCC35008]|uniref:DUF1302 domain-containing protein n=1 Tax=Desulfopila sp. IMCC35008 TaxID=2653858 RepID=UPI0013D55298|nr:DUF1302 domain-containing protein [Desulfopila sp. IMCC35008]
MKLVITNWKVILVTGVMVMAATLWLLGLLTSPGTSPQTRQQRLYLNHYIQNNAPDLKETRLLAEVYWKRYPDVGSDAHFGRNGIMGIHGALAHYNQHGKIEERRWGE